MYINWKIQYCKDVTCLKLLYVVLIKIPVDFFFVQMDKPILKFMWK